MKGNVEQRGATSWRLTAYLGYNPQTGEQNRPRKTVQAQNRRQAERLLREWIMELEKGLVVADSNMTLIQFAEEWLKKHCEARLAPKTVHTYREKLNGHILPVLGKIKLCNLKPKMLVDFFDQLRQPNQRRDSRDIPDKKLSDTTILHCYRVLSALLQTALTWQMIAVNPIRNVKPPKVVRKKAPVYEEAMIQAICAAIKQEPLHYQAMVVLDLFTGVRLGELLGLAWEYVDLEAGIIQIRQTVQYVPGKGTFIKPTPKNAFSERGITIPAVVVAMLKAHYHEQQQAKENLADKWQEHGLVFTKWDGRPFLPNILSNWFPDFLKKHHLPHLNFHGLRHYNATFLLSMGIPIHNVQAHTGHARASTLLDIYGHAMKSGNEMISAKLAEVIAPHLEE